MDTLVSDHAGLDVLPYAEYLRLLAHAPLGRISFMIDGDVVIMPVNHGLDAAWCSAPLPLQAAGGQRRRRPRLRDRRVRPGHP